MSRPASSAGHAFCDFVPASTACATDVPDAVCHRDELPADSAVSGTDLHAELAGASASGGGGGTHPARRVGVAAQRGPVHAQAREQALEPGSAAVEGPAAACCCGSSSRRNTERASATRSDRSTCSRHPPTVHSPRDAPAISPPSQMESCCGVPAGRVILTEQLPERLALAVATTLHTRKRSEILQCYLHTMKLFRGPMEEADGSQAILGAVESRIRGNAERSRKTHDAAGLDSPLKTGLMAVYHESILPLQQAVEQQAEAIEIARCKRSYERDVQWLRREIDRANPEFRPVLEGALCEVQAAYRIVNSDTFISRGDALRDVGSGRGSAGG